MYNQVNHGPHTPMQPAYQQRHQAPPPSFHFQQGSPAPPVQHVPTAVPPHIAPHVYMHGPPAPSSTVPLNPSVQGPSNLVQNTGQSYVVPRPLLHGNSMIPQTFSSFGQNSQHSSNLGVHTHQIPRPVPPPPLSNPHQETSWAPGPPLRVLPPPPPLPPSSYSQGQSMYQHSVPPRPPQPGDVQSLQHIPPPPPAPSTSGFHASTPDGVYLHSSVGNCQVHSCPHPPLPSSPPPILPSPPPSNSPMTSASDLAVSNLPRDHHSDPKSSKRCSTELKTVDSVDEVGASDLSGIAPFSKESGSNREAAIADKDGLSLTRNAILDLPPPPCRPTEDKIVGKIEAFCRLIVENGSGIEDKTRQDERENPEYAFLFGGDPGTEAAISHEYFLWVKKKYILEYRWHAKESESLSRPLEVDSSRQHDHINVTTECNSAADSDMEMEDDITLSDKDQGLNNTTEVLNQQHEEVVEYFSSKDQIRQLHNSIENNPVNNILTGGVSCSRPLGVSKECEVPELLFELEHMNSAKSVTKVHSTVNDSAEVAKFPVGNAAASLADDLTEHGVFDPAEAYPDRDSGQLIRNGSPIRLLQDYASDDSSDNEDETCFADASALTVSTAAAISASVAHKDLGSFLETDIGSKISSSTQKGCERHSNTSQTESKMSIHLVQEGEGTHTRSIASGANDRCVERNLENQVPVNFAASIEASKGKDVLSSAGIDCGKKTGNAEQDDKKISKFELNPLKVDKFGRFAREDPSDSDSNDSRNCWTRRWNKRDRSWSRSRSPMERSGRRRKRSPRRRKDKRSRSRSWSPRNRRSRSRSRSPILRRSGEFNGENARRDKGKCFDFLRGKCYRGASCRYVHHQPDKNASSRHHRNKHDQEVSSKNSRIQETKQSISAKVSGDECEGVRSQDVLLLQKVSGSSTGQEVKQRKEDFVKNSIVSIASDHDGQPVNVAPIISERSGEVAPEVSGTLVAAEEPVTIIHDNEASLHQQDLDDDFPSNSIGSGNALKLSDGASKDVFPSENGSSVQLLQSNVSIGMLERSDHPSQIINASSASDLLPDGNRLIACASEISNSKPLPHMLPSIQLQSTSSSTSQHLSSEQSPLGSQASKEFPAHSSVGFPQHSYQLPPPPALSHSYSENSVQPQMTRDYVAMQQNSLFPYLPYQSSGREPHPGILQVPNPPFFVPPNSSWTSLPPPPSQFAYSSSLNARASTSFVSSEFNENKSHPGTDFVSQNSVRPGLPSHIQGSDSQDQAYPTVQEHSQLPMLAETFSSKPVSQGNLVSQSHVGLSVGKEDHYKQLPMHDSKILSSPSFASLQSQPKPFSWESGVNRLQTSSSYKLPSEEPFKSASFIHPFSQKQQTIYSSQYSASDGNLGVHGVTVTVSRYPPDVLDSNHSASLPDFGGSRISAHYNPYASTFEQPLSSKFSSSIFRKEKDTIPINNYGSSSSLHHNPVDGQGVFGVGSRQAASSPKSARAIRQILPRSGSDQYDPLFDSIEPSSSSLRKFHLDQKQEVTGESNISLRPKSSFKSLDMEENKQWEVGAAASTSSQNNDEYGETADAEVGAVENESLSNPVDVAKMTTGEIEIDQVKSPGKRKKSKDSRSMKLFKVSIANFVKEVLKPSWRQGNMSKVAFKTIVKKTVDKVSGAMKGHRVPKSQAKINQYIDSSQRKLTKLVMGYVDKYVKV